MCIGSQRKDLCLAGCKWRSSEKRKHLLPVQHGYLSMGLGKTAERTELSFCLYLLWDFLNSKALQLPTFRFLSKLSTDCLGCLNTSFSKQKLFLLIAIFWPFYLAPVSAKVIKQQHTVSAGVNSNTSHLNMPVIGLQNTYFSPNEPTHWINPIWMGNINHMVSLYLMHGSMYFLTCTYQCTYALFLHLGTSSPQHLKSLFIWETDLNVFWLGRGNFKKLQE